MTKLSSSPQAISKLCSYRIVSPIFTPPSDEDAQLRECSLAARLNVACANTYSDVWIGSKAKAVIDVDRKHKRAIGASLSHWGVDG